MNFNSHSDLEGRHAFLSASKSHWVNYTDEKFDLNWYTHKAAMRGTALHKLACDMIKLGVKLADTGQTLNRYVNDAIGFRMTPEFIIAFSYNAFGTADALSYHFDPETERWVLRIHDLKTGMTKTTFRQLVVYSAMFCLEYDIKPADIDIRLRIYQYDAYEEAVPDLDEVIKIMDVLVKWDARIKQLQREDNR